MSWKKELKNCHQVKLEPKVFYGRKLTLNQFAESYERALDKGFEYAVADLGLSDVNIFFDNGGGGKPLMYFDGHENIIGVTDLAFLDFAKRVNALLEQGRPIKAAEDAVTKSIIEEVYHYYQFNVRHKLHGEYPEYATGLEYCNHKNRYSELLDKEYHFLNRTTGVEVLYLTHDDLHKLPPLNDVQKQIVEAHKAFVKAYEVSEIEVKAHAYVDEALAKMQLEPTEHEEHGFHLPYILGRAPNVGLQRG